MAEDMESNIMGNDLRAGHYLVVGDKLGRVREISRSKTGKHGGCKLSIKCTDAFSGKTLMHMSNSQDTLVIAEPPKTSVRLLEVPPKTTTAVFTMPGNDEGRLTLSVPDRDMLELMQEAEDKRGLDCTVMSWRNRHVLVRVTKIKDKRR